MSPAPLLDRPFDRRLRRLRRDRASAAQGRVRYLLDRAADEIVERLATVRRGFTTALAIGAAAEMAERLRPTGIEVRGADPGERFARASGGVQCDEDLLPFADGAFDLVVALGTLDTVNDLPGALTLIRRTLAPDGLFLAALAGAGSLPRLRAAMRTAEEAEHLAASPRLHPQIDVRAAGDLLARAGFVLPVADTDRVRVRFASLADLVADLRAMAATNLLAERSLRPFGRIGRAAAEAAFRAEAGADGKTEEIFEILYLTGWAPPAPTAGR